MINEENVWTALLEYTKERYANQLQEFHDRFAGECPDDFEIDDPQLYLRNFLEWFILEKPLPQTGKTIVEEFAERQPQLDERMRQMVLGMRKVVRSEFVVLGKNGLKLTLKDRATDKTYDIRLSQPNAALQSNMLIAGRIFPLGEFYRFAGVFATRHTPMIADPDVLMRMWEERSIADAERMVVSRSNLTVILNKYPAHWVNGICEALDLDAGMRKGEKVKAIAEHLQQHLPVVVQKLPVKSREALRLVLAGGGMAQYGKLKGYDDAMSFWWGEHPPESPIGLLRLHGLLAVGKMPMKGRMYKVAVIPVELRDPMVRLLEKEGAT